MSTNTWNIDSSHSGIRFSVRHMVFARVRGRFGSWRGTVAMAEQEMSRSSVSVTIDTDSIDTGTADRDKHLRSKDFFDADAYPTISFQSTDVKRIADDRYAVHGALTVKNVTQEVVVEATYLGRGKDPWGNERVGFAAKASINRADFGLTWNQVLETGGVLVGDEVEIEIEVQAVQQTSVKRQSA